MSSGPNRSTQHSLGQILWFLCLVTLLPLGAYVPAVHALPVHQQTTISVLENEHQHVFKGPMTFRLVAESKNKINSVELYYRISGQTAAHKTSPEFSPGVHIEIEHVENMDADENYQPPMITFTYWWVIEDEAGERLKTEPLSFVYTDTRYTWETLEDNQVRLYWHDQDTEFGQGYFDLATRAAIDLSVEFDVQPSSPTAIVIYNSHQELMSVLQEASSEWTGAVNFGDSGVIVIGLGAESWMQDVIPHELTHAMLHQITQPPFGDIPRWLHEGLAVRSEGGMGSEEQRALNAAIEDNTLIPLRVLNSPFPDQRQRAVLSYAESNSLVEFIIGEYGSHKLGELLSVFARGAHYDDAMMQVFGVDMDGMEERWRAHIGAERQPDTTQTTAKVQTTATQQPTIEPQSPILPIAATATAIAALPRPTTAPSSSTDSEPAAEARPAWYGLCPGALPALVLFALWAAFRPRAAT
jgi:hypothetical protein